MIKYVLWEVGRGVPGYCVRSTIETDQRNRTEGQKTFMI